jgi:8-amino-7-oxononanoate synthase
VSLDWLNDALRQRREANLLRRTSVVRHVGPALIEIGGRVLNNFAANDYLGLASHPEILGAVESASRMNESASDSSPRFGTGASPLVSGYTQAHAALETELARFEGTEAAILFSTGYAANVGTIAALVSPNDVIFSDALNHASLIDGCRLSRAVTIVYPHIDMDELEKLLRKNRSLGRRAFIVTDSLFSMDGDKAPLKKIVELASMFDTEVIVDEAHATGIYGGRGRGLVEELELEDRIAVRIGTLSKALGCLGGFVVGPSHLIEFLRNFARTYIYSTAMPIPGVEAALRALDLAHSMRAEALELRAAARAFRKSLVSLDYRTAGDDSPIIPIYFETPQEVLDRSSLLREAGHFVPAIRPPTVPRDQSLLRISLSILHTNTQRQSLLASLAQ